MLLHACSRPLPSASSCSDPSACAKKRPCAATGSTECYAASMDAGASRDRRCVKQGRLVLLHVWNDERPMPELGNHPWYESDSHDTRTSRGLGMAIPPHVGAQWSSMECPSVLEVSGGSPWASCLRGSVQPVMNNRSERFGKDLVPVNPCHRQSQG